MGVDNLKAFEASLGLSEKEVVATLSVVTRKIALDVLRGVVMRTPVDTGRARGNWQVTIALPAQGVLDRKDKNGAATVGAGSGKLVEGLNPFASIWVTNNLPYIERLEDGWSSQSPGPGAIMAKTVEAIKTSLLGGAVT